MVWNCSIVAVTLLFGVSGKSKAFRNESKNDWRKSREEWHICQKLINDLIGKQCIIRSEFIFSFAGKTELSCKIIDADDEWIKICYTEKKDKQVVKLMRIENIESIEEQ